MISRTRILSALAAPTLLLSLSAAGPAGAAITVATCASQIETQQTTLQGKIIKAFQACDKAYRIDQTKTPGNYAKSAAACEKQLPKNIGLGNGSQMDKIKAKLDSFVGTKCDDTALSLLGHLPTGKFQDLWSRAAVMAALDKAYQQEITIARDTIAMFQNMACAGASGTGQPGTATCACSPSDSHCQPGAPATTCASCEALQTPPCFEHACTYLSAGSSGFSLKSDALPIPIAGDLIGATSFTLCQFKGEGSQAINPPSEYIVTGVTSKGIKPVVITGIGHACPLAVGAEGYISCGGTHGQVDYDTCQDSTGTTDQGTCPSPQDVCNPKTTDTENGGTNGGGCIHIGASTAVSGGAFVNNSTQLNVPLGGQEGSQGACSDNDTEALALTNTIPLTTGNARTQVLNTLSGTLTNGPDTGAPFPCGTIQTSNLSGGKIAGAFPAVSQPVTNDTATIFHIACQ